MARFGRFGWFLGLIFGTVFGVLFAPGKGKELRSKIKENRKKGGLGFAPLQDDFKKLGGEIAQIAKEFYQSETVQDVVEKGRKELKKISKDMVGEVADFHYSRIKPLQSELSNKIKSGKRKGKRAIKEIKSVWKNAK